MEAFDIRELVTHPASAGRCYQEFVRVPTMSAGVFLLPAGVIDDHKPHERDELYYVLHGRGMLHVEGEDREVYAGISVFVPAGAQHHFHTITEDLAMLVFFGGERRL